MTEGVPAGPVSVEAAFKAAYDTAIGAKHLRPKQLAELVEYCRARNVLVHTIETYEHRDGFQYARPDLSLYGPREAWKELSAPERLKCAADETAQILKDAEADAATFTFQVWLDDAGEVPSPPE